MFNDESTWDEESQHQFDDDEWDELPEITAEDLQDYQKPF